MFIKEDDTTEHHKETEDDIDSDIDDETTLGFDATARTDEDPLPGDK